MTARMTPRRRGKADTEWMVDGACRGMDPNMFFPGDHRRTIEEHAAVIAACESCPVRVECLEFALATNETHGVWGGLDEEERRRLRRRRQADRRARVRAVEAMFRSDQ